jgi:hypothetical protein
MAAEESAPQTARMSSNEEIKTDIENLASRLQAQAAASEIQAQTYEKFSLTLGKLNELLRAIDEKLIDVKDITKDSLLDLVRSVTVIGAQLHTLVEWTRDNDNQMVDRVDDLLKFILELTHENQVKEDHIRVLISKVEETQKAIILAFTPLQTAITQIIAERHDVVSVKATIEHVSLEQTRLADLLTAVHVKKNFWTHAKVWAYALGSIIAIVETLIQLGLLKLVFAPK